MKTLTFNIICGLLLGVERGIRREKLVGRFQEMIEGIWSVPVNLPFTRYNRSLQASTKIQNMIKELMREKEVELEKGASPHQDFITCLLSIRGKNNEEVITEKEIVDNVMLVMVAGHDTSAVLITFLVRLLANDPDVYAAVLKGTNNSLTRLIIINRKFFSYPSCSRIHYPSDSGTNYASIKGVKGLFNCLFLDFRTWGDSKRQALRGVPNMGRPGKDEVHMESGTGNSEDGSSGLCWVQDCIERHWVWRISYPWRVEGKWITASFIVLF